VNAPVFLIMQSTLKKTKQEHFKLITSEIQFRVRFSICRARR